VDAVLDNRIPPSVEIVLTGSIERRLFGIPRLERVLRHSLHALGLPEKQFPWHFSACRAGLELLRGGHFDVIHSWACYHTSNVVGLTLKRASGVPLVAHFSDPWVDNPLVFLWPLQRALSRRLEAVVIGEADALVFVTEQAAAKIMAKYPAAWRGKVHVIPHGYDDVFPTPPSRPGLGRPLRLTYTGSVYGGRHPEAFLRALARLQGERALDKELEVVLCGPGVPRYAPLVQRLELQRVVECRGPLPFGEAAGAAAAADVLLVIDAPSEGPSVFLPSKVVEYLAFRKPILGLTPQQGATADLLERLGSPVAPPDDDVAIAAALSEILSLWRREALRIAPQFAQVARNYESRVTARRLDSLLSSVARGAAAGRRGRPDRGESVR
jgi:glycosyltransferase involved in cell wall biosynthesis